VRNNEIKRKFIFGAGGAKKYETDGCEPSAPDKTSTSCHLPALSSNDTPTAVGKCWCSQTLSIVQSLEMVVGNSIVLRKCINY